MILSGSAKLDGEFKQNNYRKYLKIGGRSSIQKFYGAYMSMYFASEFMQYNVFCICVAESLIGRICLLDFLSFLFLFSFS